MELVKPDTDPIVNVGIKQSQKDKIVELTKSSDRYKSINEFVQEAVSKLIESEYKKAVKDDDAILQIMEGLKKINVSLLKNEIFENHKLTDSIIRFIQDVRTLIVDFVTAYKIYSSYDDKTYLLLKIRSFKAVLDSYISLLETDNRLYKLGIPDSIITELKNSRTKFIYYSTQEVKG